MGRPSADAPIQEHINWYVKQGYHVVVSQTETSAQLVKPKRFSFIWALLWFLVLGIGFLVYLFYYLGKRDQTVYLAVGADGKVSAS
jgi:hypothetical protein